MRRLLSCALGLAAAAVGPGCEPACRNDEITRAASPDGRWDAVVFARRCGASEPPTSEVSVVPRGAAVAGGGNVFAAAGEPTVVVWWDGPAALSVRHAPGEVRTREPRVGGVRIAFYAAARADASTDPPSS